MKKKKRGHLEVICGSMFSGKSEELIRLLKRAIIANKKVQLFKPRIDDRYSDTEVVTHDGSSRHKSQVVEDAKHLLSLVEDDTRVVGIDEVQFFDKDIVEVIDTLTQNGKRVIVAGLDMYSSGDPFGEIGTLMAKAKYVKKIHAVCVGCGENSYYSHAISENKETNTTSKVEVGSFGKYIAVCENCRDDF